MRIITIQLHIIGWYADSGREKFGQWWMFCFFILGHKRGVSGGGRWPCQRRALYVLFRDLGWQVRVIPSKNKLYLFMDSRKFENKNYFKASLIDYQCKYMHHNFSIDFLETNYIWCILMIPKGFFLSAFFFYMFGENVKRQLSVIADILDLNFFMMN